MTFLQQLWNTILDPGLRRFKSGVLALLVLTPPLAILGTLDLVSDEILAGLTFVAAFTWALVNEIRSDRRP